MGCKGCGRDGGAHQHPQGSGGGVQCSVCGVRNGARAPQGTAFYFQLYAIDARRNRTSNSAVDSPRWYTIRPSRSSIDSTDEITSVGAAIDQSDESEAKHGVTSRGASCLHRTK